MSKTKAAKPKVAKRPRKDRITIGDIRVPENRDEVNTLIEEIAALRGSIDHIERTCDEKVAQVQKEAADEMKPLINRLNERAQQVHAFHAAHRAGLTDDGRTKTVRFPAGTCSWRTSGGKVSIKGAKDVLKRLKTLGPAFRKFIRVKETIDKEAMLKDSDRAALVEGVTITKGEIFSIKPVTTNVEELV